MFTHNEFDIVYVLPSAKCQTLDDSSSIQFTSDHFSFHSYVQTTSPESPTNKYRPQMPNHTDTMLFFDIIITYFPHSKITRKKFHSKLPHLTILHPVYVHLHHARQTDNHRATLTWYLYLLTCNKLTLLLVL